MFDDIKQNGNFVELHSNPRLKRGDSMKALKPIEGGFSDEQVDGKTLLFQTLIDENLFNTCLLYTSPSPRDVEESRMPSSA